MTWAKFGDQFADECADADLSDGAFRLHTEAVVWLYRIERDDCQIPKRVLARFAGGSAPEAAARELASVGFWRDDGAVWTVVHHANVIRQSIGFQRETRVKTAARQRKHRAKVAAKVTRDVTGDVTRESRKTLPTKQTSTKGGTSNGASDYEWTAAPTQGGRRVNDPT